MAVTRMFKVYGIEGHRQRETFSKSYRWDFSTDNKTRIIEVSNSDKTGTNEYSLVKITRDTAEDCLNELDGQISDGIFENSRVGEVKEVKDYDINYQNGFREEFIGTLREAKEFADNSIAYTGCSVTIECEDETVAVRHWYGVPFDPETDGDGSGAIVFGDFGFYSDWIE